jgi:peroxiredoxin
MLSRPLKMAVALLLIINGHAAIAAETSGDKPRLMENPVPAPSFSLEDIDGKLHKLEDYRGHVVVVNFWATWCPPCRREMPSMEQASHKLKEHQIAMLAINVGEDVDTIFRFTADYPVTFPLLLDRDSSVIQKWPVRGLPTTFVVDKQGNIVYRVIGGRDWNSPEIVNMLIDLQNQ